MSEIRVLIVEDDPIICQDLSEMLVFQGLNVVGLASSYDQAISVFEVNRPDVLLVDIKLKGEKDGVDLVKKINESHGDIFPVVFLTANSDKETKYRAFNTSPSTFLTKPYNEQDLVNSLELAFNQKSSDMRKLFVKTSDRYIKVDQNEIRYLKADGSYCRIYTRTNEHLISVNLNQCALKLQRNRFLRIHRSFLVNRREISAVDKQHVYIGNLELPIGRKYKEEVFKALDTLP